MIMKPLMAAMLAASLALTGLSAKPAAAQISEDDALAGILTLLFLGAIIHNNRNDTPSTPAPTQQPRTQPDGNWRVLPVECLRVLDTRRGETVRLFTQRCLNNNYHAVHRLPQECHVRIRTQSGQPRQGYLARCLRNAGFRTNRR